MTEKEKAAAGLLYDANYNAGMLAERQAAAELCYDYNQLRPSQIEEKERILSRLLGHKGDNCVIVQPLHVDNGFNIEVGNNFFANYNFTVLDEAKVIIGDNVFIAPNVGIYCAGHPFDVELRNKGLEYALPVTIGDNVWIGAGVQIMPGVTIGSGTTIGAGSIVTKDIPSNVIAAGNPCRIIREITDYDRKKYK
ncbi:MAG: sugar O-acetyltransferase [Muribaculaceae bacterium]|nr:sugar O-acetyltransferase [Muribaculaceae bacterium]